MSGHRHDTRHAEGTVGRTALTMGALERLGLGLLALVPLWLAVWWALS